MGLIRIRETGQVVTEITFRKMHRKTRPVLENPITAERLSQLGADPVFEGPAATVTPPYEFSYQSGVEQMADGKWFTVYSVGPVFEDYTDEGGVLHTAADQLAEYRAQIDERTAATVRDQRNRLLAETDWLVIMHAEKGTTVPADMAAYRQALRDITSHVRFPHLSEEDWPAKP